MEYDIKQHTHNFAVWTAARAVARNFAKTEIIKSAIEASNIQRDVEESRGSDEWTQDTFDQKHQEWAEAMIKAIGGNDKCSYGRAAKIIAVYLKTAVILPEKGEGALARVIHPPIDRILLTNLKKIEVECKTPWTQLDKDGYDAIINQIKEYFKNKPLWHCEKHWSVGNESEADV
jgi:hypothetical protein